MIDALKVVGAYKNVFIDSVNTGNNIGANNESPHRRLENQDSDVISNDNKNSAKQFKKILREEVSKRLYQ